MKNPIAVPTHLGALVDYQPDSVVSRVIFRNAGGTLTLFAFAEGEGLSEHTNPNDAILLCLEGRVSVDIGGVEHSVGSGEALHLPASVPHSLKEGAPYKMLLTLLRVGQEG